MRNRFSRWIRQACCLLAAAAMTASLSAGAAEEVYKLPIDLSGGMKYDAEASWSKDQNLYEDPTIRAEFHEFRENRINPADELEHGVYFCYVDVTIQDASQLRTAAGDAKDFTRGIMKRTLDIARRVQAVVAVDGDFCNSYYGEEANKYCLRQGVVYRDTVVDYLDMLLIDEDGDFHILQGGPELAGADKEEIDGKKVVNAFQFGPALVIDGENVPEEYILDRAHSPWSAEPELHSARMCIGQIDELSYIVFTCWDGMNLAQLRDLVLSITPVKTLYVMDGGNSAQLVYLKSQINRDDNATGNGRDIQDIIYFASAYFEE